MAVQVDMFSLKKKKKVTKYSSWLVAHFKLLITNPPENKIPPCVFNKYNELARYGDYMPVITALKW